MIQLRIFWSWMGLKNLSMMYTPHKCNIDTKNGHLFEKNHYFQGPSCWVSSRRFFKLVRPTAGSLEKSILARTGWVWWRKQGFCAATWVFFFQNRYLQAGRDSWWSVDSSHFNSLHHKYSKLTLVRTLTQPWTQIIRRFAGFTVSWFLFGSH